MINDNGFFSSTYSLCAKIILNYKKTIKSGYSKHTSGKFDI